MTFCCTWRSSVLSTWTEPDGKAANSSWKIYRPHVTQTRCEHCAWEERKKLANGRLLCVNLKKVDLHWYVHISGECNALYFRPVSLCKVWNKKAKQICYYKNRQTVERKGGKTKEKEMQQQSRDGCAEPTGAEWLIVFISNLNKSFYISSVVVSENLSRWHWLPGYDDGCCWKIYSAVTN